MSDESLRNMLVLLDAAVDDWDVVMVQEGPKRELEELSELDGGHYWYIAPCDSRPRSVAILLHSKWCSRGAPKFCSIDGRVAQVDVQIHGLKLRLLSAHLPHGDRSDVEYEAALSCLECAVKDAESSQRHVAIGIDANAVLGCQSLHDSKRVIGKWGLHARNERGVTFAAWLHLVHLAACNTMFDKPYAKTCYW